jgi:O-antigen/teichoic acid export membrane protein
LLLAGSALLRVGDVSGAGALSRFVAMRSPDNGPGHTRNVVHTVMLTSFGLNTVLAFAFYMFAPLVLPRFIAPEYLGEALALLPFVVGTMVLGSLSIAVSSAIDGAQRADQRAVVLVVAALIFLFSSWLLIPQYGVIGFGIAQVVQQIVILVLGWHVLRRHVSDLGWMPFHWRRDVFGETAGFAIKLNAIGVVGLLFDPLVKFAFNHTGGPGLVAIYELASRLVVQMRGFVIAAATPLVPAFAAHSDSSDVVFRRTLENSIRFISFASVGVALGAVIGAPIVSLIVLEKLSPEMLIMSTVLTFGWAINVLAIPFYFAAQGQGYLRWNFASHVLIAAWVVVGVFLPITVFGHNGLLISTVFGLALSTPVVIFGNSHLLGIHNACRAVRAWLGGAAVLIMFICAVSIWLIFQLL